MCLHQLLLFSNWEMFIGIRKDCTKLLFVPNLFVVIFADAQPVLLSKSEVSQIPGSSRLPTIVTKVKNMEAVPSPFTQAVPTLPVLPSPPPPPPPPPPLRSPVRPTQTKISTTSSSERPESSKQSDVMGPSSIPSPIGVFPYLVRFYCRPLSTTCRQSWSFMSEVDYMHWRPVYYSMFLPNNRLYTSC